MQTYKEFIYSKKFLPSQSKMKVSTESISSPGFVSGCVDEALVTILDFALSILDLLQFHLILFPQLFNGLEMLWNLFDNILDLVNKSVVEEEEKIVAVTLLLSILYFLFLLSSVHLFRFLVVTNCTN